ncbi:hypothetical protein [Acetobacter sp. P1H12_c]|uniref:hypothetical protein n=1 Tax=Acetobacter sp. P1H12_c TaxID=2762621 RepID=UPI001C04007D|nr:hypothetical protein [Acetobacter sp. P1H12_c]
MKKIAPVLRAFCLSIQNEGTDASRHRFPQFHLTHTLHASVATPEGVAGLC